MNDETFDAYVAAWLGHVKAGSTPEGQANLERFLSFLAPEVTWEDVPSGHSFSGHDGVAQMCAIVADSYDVSLEVLGTVHDDERFAIEFASTLTIAATGATVTSRGVSTGTIADGRISSSRDYYDASALAAGAA